MNYLDLDLFLRWIHILSAIVLGGGLIFWRFSLLPALDGLGQASREQFERSLRTRWSRWVMLTSGLLLITGLVNAVLAIQRYQFDGPLYHILVLVKLLLALAIFWIAPLLVSRSARADRFRQRSRFWLNVNVALVVVLVCIAGVMRMTDRTPKLTTIPTAGATESHDSGHRKPV